MKKKRVGQDHDRKYRDKKRSERIQERITDIAVIGMACRFPGAANYEEFWQNLKQGCSGIQEIPRKRWDWQAYWGDPQTETNKINSKWGAFIEDIDAFDLDFFGFTAREAETMDPQQRIMLELTWSCLEDAGIRPSSLSGEKIGVFTGTAILDYKELQEKEPRPIEAHYATGIAHSVLANRISYYFNFKGPSFPLDTACSSSLTAIHSAIGSLERGECRMALAGGVNLLLTPHRYISFSKMGILSPTGSCKSFDDSADGIVRGEGAGVILLKPLEQALKDGDSVYGIIKGSAINHSGKTYTLSYPNPDAQAAVIADACKRAMLSPRTISYIEAHGTGTPKGDPLEFQGLVKAFEDDSWKEQKLKRPYCGIASVKTNIGHLESAAGIAGVIKVLLCLKNKELPGLQNFKRLNHRISIEGTPFYLIDRLHKWNQLKDDKNQVLPRRAGISSFGFSGTNAHVVLEEAPAVRRSPDKKRSWHLICLSAKTEQALQRKERELALWLAKEGRHHSLFDISANLLLCREYFGARSAYLARNVRELQKRLDEVRDQGRTEGCFRKSGEEQGKQLHQLSSESGGTLLKELSSGRKISDQELRAKLAALAELYAKGHDLDWKMLYRVADFRRVSLPTYPFARERYWLPEVKTNNAGSYAADTPSPGRIHPLLHRNTSDFSGIRFTSGLTGEEFFLAEHIVKGRRVLPGVAHLEMARAAIDQLKKSRNEEERIQLNNIVWVRPIAAGKRPLQISVKLYHENNGEIAYEIYSEPDAPGAERTVHSQGRAELIQAAPAANLDLEALQAECNVASFSSGQFYEAFGSMGIDLGAGFQCIHRVHVGKGKALSELFLPATAAYTKDQYVLHPGLMDSALQGCITIGAPDMFSSAGTPVRKTLLPFHLQTLEIIRPLSGKMWSSIRYSAGGGPEDEVKKFDVDVCDQTGFVCARVRGFSLRALEGEVRSANAGATPGQPLAGTVMAVPVWDAMPLQKSKLYPAPGDRIAVVGGASESRRIIEEHYPQARALDIQPQDTIDEIADKMKAIEPLDHVIWIAPHTHCSLTDDAFLQQHEVVVLPAFRTIKALLHLGYGSRRFGWTVLTTEALSIAKKDVVNPAHATLHGLIGSLANEYANWSVRVVDREAGAQWPLDDIFCLSPDFYGNTWGCRGREWHRQKLVPLQKFQPRRTLYKPEGVYVVIGGAGGIGEVWTEYVLRGYQARVIWIGRRQKDRVIREKLERLSKLGPEPYYISADATDLDALERAYGEIKKRHPRIHGVIHSVIVLLDQSLANMSEERFKTGLAAKVDVSVRLAQVFQKEKLDFMLFFSSINSFLKSPGQSNYVAGCMFKDAFARRLSQEGTGPAKVVNWGYWGSAGVVASKPYQDRMDQIGHGSIDPAEAMEALERLLGGPLDQIALMNITKPFPMDGLTPGESIFVTESGGVVRQEQPRKSAAASFPDENNRTTDPLHGSSLQASPRQNNDIASSQATRIFFETGTVSVLEEQVRTVIRESIASALHMEEAKIDDERSFAEIGIDSITGVALLNTINKEFRMSLPSTVLFDCNNVNRLVDHLVKEHGSGLICLMEKNVRSLEKAGPADRREIRLPIEKANFTDDNDGGRQRPRIAETDGKTENDGSGTRNKAGSISTDPIAIIGMSGRFAQSDTVDELWDNLANGIDLVEEVKRWDLSKHHLRGKPFCKHGSFLRNIDRFDNLFFNISGLEAAYMDPQQRIFLEEAWKALENAGYAGAGVQGLSCGVYVGSVGGDYHRLFEDEAPAQAFWGNAYSVIPARIAYYLDLQGPAVAIDTACSSSLVAVHFACQGLWNNETEMALAGGIYIQSTPEFYIRAERADMLSHAGRCHTFDERADGFVPGEGAGVLVLKRLKDAVAAGDHVYGVIRGSGINQDGATNGITAPSANSQERLERRVYDTFQVHPETIQMVEAHGTGTKLGDPIEYHALTRAFGNYTDKKQYCAIGSIKTNLGHAVSAAGVASLIKILLSLQHKQIPPSLHFETGNSHIQFKDGPFYVNTGLKDWEVQRSAKRRAVVSSFGFSGTNAHMVIEEAPKNERRHPEKPGYLIFLSARTFPELRRQVERLTDHCDREAGTDCGNLSYTLLLGRKHLQHRLACVVRNLNELVVFTKKFLGKGKLPQMYVSDPRENDRRERHVLKKFGNQCIENCKKISSTAEYLENLSMIAELYVQGYSLDFEQLFAKEEFSRIPLPVYPFTGERFWAPQNAGPRTGDRDQVIHPLLQKNTSNLSEQRFSSTFTGQEFFLADHLVKGQPVLPGMVHFEMVRAAVQEAAQERENGRTGMRIKNMVWVRPITAGDQPAHVHLSLHPENDGEIFFKIHEQSGEAGAEPKVYSQGRVTLTDAPEIPTLNIQALREQCSENTLSSDKCYEIIRTFGIWHGPRYQGLEVVHVGPDKGLGKLSLPSSVADTLDQFPLHPTFLESALHAGIGSMMRSDGPMRADGNGAFTPALPFALEELDIYGACTPTMWSFVRYSDGSKPGDKVQRFDVDMCDETGKISVRMKGLSYRVLEGELGAKVSPEKTGVLMLEPSWEEQTVARETEVVAYDTRVAMLCELSHVSAESIENRIPAVRCFNLQQEQNGVDARFRGYAVKVFEEIKSILKDKPNGNVLVQIVVSRENEQQLFSGLSGLLKTARLENPKVIGQLIEGEQGENSETITKKLNENSRTPLDNHVRYLQGKRYVARWSEVEPSQKEVSIPWKDGAVYLITGGAGGLGLILVKEIARTVRAATLILTGRSPLSETRQAQLKELESPGARIVYKQSDVSRKEAVTDLIQGIRQEFGGLNGIIHAAGEIRDNFIINKSAEEAREVLSPKVSGVVNLDQACRDVDLDFFVLFSSGAAAIGNIGQADYAAANAFLDAYAEYRNQLAAENQRKGKTLSINWPLWKEGGMRVNAEVEKMMLQSAGMAPMQTANGIRALYRGMASGKSEVMVLEGNLARIRQKMCSMAGPGALKSIRPVSEGDSALRSDTDDLLAKVQGALLRSVSRILKVNVRDIDPDAELTKYGFDSIMLTEYSNTVNQEYSLALTPTFFFEHPTLAGCAEYLVKEHKAALASKFGVQPGAGGPEPGGTAAPLQSIGHEADEKRSGANRQARFIRTAAMSAHKPDSRGHAGPMAIVGMSGRFPLAKDVNEFWKNLVEGRDCITEIPKERWDWQACYGDAAHEANKTKIKWGGFIEGVDGFDPLFFGISPREAELMDPQQRLLMMYVWKAIEDSAINPKLLSQTVTGVFIAAGQSEYAGNFSNPQDKPFSLTASVPSMIPNRISYALNLRGPSEYCETACSSTLVALHRAIQSIRSHECEQAIVGAVNLLLSPGRFFSFDSMGYLSPEGRTKSFQADANGYARCEGVGAIIIKPLDRAVEDEDFIYAVIKGTGVAHGGKGMSLTTPNAAGMKAAMMQAYQASDIDPRTVSYIEAHGIASPLADGIEIAALTSGYQELAASYDRNPDATSACVISSLKPCVGHGELVSGMAALIKVILAMRHRTIPGVPRFTQLNQNILLEGGPFRITGENRAWEAMTDAKGNMLPRRASINNYGFGGVNAHLVLEEYSAQKEFTPANSISSPQIVVLSARNPERLRAVVERMLEFIDDQENVSLPDFAYTLQVGREAMQARLAIVVNSREELIQGLKAYLESEQQGPAREASVPVFTGNVEEDRSGTKNIFSGKTGETVAQALLEENDLEKIAFHWAQGGPIPWTLLHRVEKARRMPLPAYPFDAKRYWVAGAGEPPLQKREDIPPPVRQRDDRPDAIIKRSMGALLGMPSENLPTGTPLSHLGYTSIHAVTLRHALEKDFGKEIPIALVGVHTTIDELAHSLGKIIETGAGEKSAERRDGNDTQSDCPNAAASCSSGLLPEIIPAPADRYQPFPLNDVQEAFLTGRKLRIGGDWVGCHVYFEIEIHKLDIYRLNKAWERLIGHHEMLRCVILSDGRQKILEETPAYMIKVSDLRRKSEHERSAHLEQARKTMSHKVYECEAWPLFEIRISVCPDAKYIIHFSLDELVVDGRSISMLLQQWQRLYENPDAQLPPIHVSFRDYIGALKRFEDSKRRRKDMEYWKNKLTGMPGGPALPLNENRGNTGSREMFFRNRLSGALSQRQWLSLKKKAETLRVSATALLLTVFSEVLHCWSNEEAFSLIMTYYNRPPLHPQMEHILGPFISTNIFIVEKKDGLGLDELISRHQECLWKDLDHSAISGVSVLRELRAKHKISHSLFLPVVFTSLVNNLEAGESAHNALMNGISFAVTQTPHVYLDHQVFELDGKLKFSWDVAEGCFKPGLIKDMFSHYCRLLELLSSQDAAWDTHAARSLFEATGTADEKPVGGGSSDEREQGAMKSAQDRTLPAASLPGLSDDKFGPFPLTDLQQAYVFGRSKLVSGHNNGSLFYQEFEVERLDIACLESAWKKLLKAHEMLVTMIQPDGAQRTLKEFPDFKIKVADLRGGSPEEAGAELSKTKRLMTERVFDLAAWPYFDLRVSLVDSVISRIHFSIDLVIADASSIQLLMEQLIYFTRNPRESPKKCDFSFRDYVLSLQRYRRTEASRKSFQYWEDKFSDLPDGPQLPLKANIGKPVSSEREQFEGVIDGWRAFEAAAAELDVAPGMALLTAYAEVVSAWSDNKPFSLVVPCWERLPLHPDIDQVIGDFTAMSWVAFPGNAELFEEKVRVNHKIVQADLSHMAVCGLKALRKKLMKGGGSGKLSFPVVFTNMMGQSGLEKARGRKNVVTMSKTPQVHLDNISMARGCKLHCHWDAVKGVYPEGMLEAMFSGYLRLLTKLADYRDAWRQSDFASVIDAQPLKYRGFSRNHERVVL